MTHSGFEAAPADFAAAAPRIAQTADDLSAALDRTVARLEDQGPFRAGDAESDHGYPGNWRDAADLAAECERALRAMAEQLAEVSRAYQRTDAACAEAFDGLGPKLDSVAPVTPVTTETFGRTGGHG